ncbi:radical SAM/SPASM domain-containing protein [Burkholderia sp. BDU5]|uniref:radical SAM/SPASM domain-containing protein n=1 Tax=Burkholderia sp. BDU5 TaxID=1385590 RepID=UPI000A79AFC5|nr:radical SAM protein [Burkholderia sp. BDU5]
MSPFVHRREFFGGLLYDRHSKEYIYLDKLADRLLTRPDSPLSPEEYVQFNTDADEVSEIRTSMGIEGLLSSDVQFVNNAVPAASLSAPLRIFYEITERCPESCEHCYTNSDKKDPNELTMSQKLELIDQMTEMGCYRISIAGGEPLADRDFFPLVEYALARGVDVSFSTNATLITDKNAERLASLDIRTINISLDGWDDESFGAVRGRGRLKYVIRGLERLRSVYRGKVAAKCTILKTNVRSLEKIIQFAELLGFDTVKFNCVREAGRANAKEWLLPTPQEYISAMKCLAEICNSKKYKTKITLPLNPYEHRGGHASQYIEELGFGCYAGKESFCVTAIGEIQPCSSFGRGVYSDGYFPSVSLRSAWDNGQAMLLFRSMDGSADCKGCGSYSGCKGGCYLRSYAATGGIETTDPYCYEGYGVGSYPNRTLRIVVDNSST